jgi:hypothetical protein
MLDYLCNYDWVFFRNGLPQTGSYPKTISGIPGTALISPICRADPSILFINQLLQLVHPMSHSCGLLAQPEQT